VARLVPRIAPDLVERMCALPNDVRLAAGCVETWP
jgi:hypothetical protein